MECNRDEAVRSRSIAEQKFLQHDVLGARKFALKAQYLFPDLEGLPQLLAVLDVHVVAQQKVDGVDVNWYGILQTDASADAATIRKQYRKLALILHPDKNKAIGAEAAFKLISEAWRVLSDKEKKAVHDARRSGYGFNFSAKKSVRGFYNFTHFRGFCQPIPAGSLKKSFWTGCPSCKMQFEFMRVYENKRIPCPTCSKVFRATEMHAAESSFKWQPAEQSRQAGRSSHPEKQAQKDRGNPSCVDSSFSFHWGLHKFSAAKYANATAQMVQETYEAVRRERIKAKKEAREKAAMARMEADMEAMKRDRKKRKQRLEEHQEEAPKYPTQGLEDNGTQRREEHQEEAPKYPTQGLEDNGMLKAAGAEFGRPDDGTFLPTKEFAKDSICMSSVNNTNSEMVSASCIGEKAVRFDQMQESFWCRNVSGFDSTNSHDSSDAFAFSKRLKVDV